MRGNLPQEIKELLLKLEGMDPGLPKADKCSLLQNRDYDSKDLKKKKKKKTEARKTPWERYDTLLLAHGQHEHLQGVQAPACA